MSNPVDPAATPVDPNAHGACAVDPNAPAFQETVNPFIAEFEVCDLTELKGKSFLVAVSTGGRDKGRFLATTARGPFDFDGMVEDVGTMWEKQQHHAKVVIMQTDRNTEFKFVDENTTAYIEAHWEKVLMDNIFENALETQEFTCKAGLLEANSKEEEKKS